jgi:hypothetical protein
MWRAGTPGNLLNRVRSLPGPQLNWNVEDLIGNQLFRENVSLERFVGRDFDNFTFAMRERVAPNAVDCDVGFEVPLGARGVVAYSPSPGTTPLPIYNPPGSSETTTFDPPSSAALVGNCDVVFKFGEGTGDSQGRFLAVVELKKFHRLETLNYHRHSNAVCAQIHTSLFGSGAPLGIVVGNGLWKAFWTKVADGATLCFTFPPGNTMATFSLEGHRFLFAELIANIVIRSLIFTVSPRVIKFEKAESEKEVKDEGLIHREPLKKKARFESGQQHGGVTNVRAMNGVMLTFEAVDFSGWSVDEMTSLSQYLAHEEKEEARLVSQKWNERMMAVNFDAESSTFD